MCMYSLEFSVSHTDPSSFFFASKALSSSPSWPRILGALEPQILALRGESSFFHQHGPQDPGGRKGLEGKPAAKSLQSCLTLCDPIDGSPPGSTAPGILQARTLEWVAISLSNEWTWKVKVKSLSCIRLLATPWTAAHQAPPSMGVSRQEYWSGVPGPSPEDKPRHLQPRHLQLELGMNSPVDLPVNGAWHGQGWDN